ncbi:MAG: phosphoribosylformylglycinamidine synthase subunit PurL [Parvularculales bacterium]
MTAIPVTTEALTAHGLTENEYRRIVALLNRHPNPTELGIFSAMWSEHCSYKSSRKWLKTLPTTGEVVICGPGENAGVVDIGDNQAIVFKMESHNHPSYIEPYQGAATGVGGIMRDVFTMGARPIANLNALHFGSTIHEKTRHFVSGVVAGIGGYGNCIGVPTVGGKTAFDASYNDNILVNAMCVGLVEHDRIFYASASGIDNPVVYVGSKTGRDGIHGATMSSAGFDDAAHEKRPAIQVGDPFMEKLLMEACLELMGQDAIIAIQDMGAAGLTSSAVEMADKGGVGIDMNLDAVPRREAAMNAYEIMLSESQERMLMVLKPKREEIARQIFEKWGLDFSVIGHLTDSHHLVLRQEGTVVADIPLQALAGEAPMYERPCAPLPNPTPIASATTEACDDPMATLKTMLGEAALCSRQWIWEQYDHSVMGDTVQGPGGDAAVVRVHGSNKGLALTVNVTPRYVKADPIMGGRQAVAEAWRVLTAVGAQPLAITDCLNFGNPEDPNVMAQFAGAVQGIGQACEVLSFPVVSGNVSFYNETSGVSVLPTPTVGGVGLINTLVSMTSLAFKDAGEAIILVGESRGHLGCSLYHALIHNCKDGAPPPVYLESERRNGNFVRTEINNNIATAVHALTAGGILVGIARMAMAGAMGARLTLPATDLPTAAFLFGEDQSRYLLTCPMAQAEEVLKNAVSQCVPAVLLGRTGGDELTIADYPPISWRELAQTHRGWLPAYMGRS